MGEVAVAAHGVAHPQLEPHGATNVEPTSTANDATFYRWIQHARVGPLGRCRRHDCGEALSYTLSEHGRARHFAHRTLYLSRRLAALGAAVRDLDELFVGIRRRG